ncbi:hypothetical protein TrCOL_g1860 [Triparma columacea]|uniref:Uncharacterized protein n=1 Tax=Triparma columacea TaxID=722753 RepID=A0A9W7G4A4_9STRA|nr:hypothetical protein TrCOL_g1860 [Triparma columacea]
MLARREDGAVTLGGELGGASKNDSGSNWKSKSGHLSVDDADSDAESDVFGKNRERVEEPGIFVGLIKVVASGLMEALEKLFSGDDPGSRSQTMASQDSFSPDGKRRTRRSCSAAMTKEIRRKSLVLRCQKARKDAIIKFNTKPKLAVQYLQEHAGMICNPAEFAEWIYEFIESLSKKKIGEFLGSSADFNVNTLESFLRFHDFTDLSLSNALRQLLRTFRLPGEAQVIDRILERFAKRFIECNPKSFRCEDGAYVLAFSIIMLNTDLHNKSIPEHKKMKLEEFVRNNRGIDDGQDPPREMLERIYTNIRDEEILMNESDMYESDVVTFIAPHKAGWLEKKGQGRVTKWKKHWFVLADSCLYYFLKPADDNPRCIIPLDNTRVGRGMGRLEIELTGADGEVMKSAKNLPDGSMEVGDRKGFILRAPSNELREEWVKVLQAHMDRSPIHKRIREKKFDEWNAAGAHNRDAAPVELPPPSAEGWMKKRGENNTGWRMRYFCVFEDTESCMLYYYGSKEMAQRMIDLGDETHKGCLDLHRVEKMVVAKDGSDVVLDLLTSNRTWHFSTTEKDVLTYWMGVFTRSCPMLKERSASSSNSSYKTAVAWDKQESRAYSL